MHKCMYINYSRYIHTDRLSMLAKKTAGCLKEWPWMLAASRFPDIVATSQLRKTWVTWVT